MAPGRGVPAPRRGLRSADCRSLLPVVEALAQGLGEGPQCPTCTLALPDSRRATALPAVNRGPPDGGVWAEIP